MDKKVVQDIVPSNRRGVRSLAMRKIEQRKYEDSKEIEVNEQEDVRLAQKQSVKKSMMRRMPQQRFQPDQKKFPAMLVTFGVIFIGIAIIAVALSLLYSKAVVTITPKTANFDIGGTFTAKKDATFPDLAYTVLTVTESATQTVPAIDGPLTQTKSKGTVIFYNAQTTAQKIVAGTRISNSGGLIYRIVSTITIPSQKGIVPGTISVSVLADQVGAEYNMIMANSPENLKVVAYKGQSKYTTVYAKLKTDIIGGFSGTKKIISPTAKAATIKSIQDGLKTKLLANIKTIVTEGSIFYPNAYTVSYAVSDPVSKDKISADITIKGTMTAALFKQDALIKSVANKELDKFPSQSYDIIGLDKLTFSIVNAKDFSAQKGTPLIFTLKGLVLIIGTFEQNALKNELKGTYLKNSNSIFAHYPSIASAYALITPFWMRSFPSSIDKIEIDIND